MKTVSFQFTKEKHRPKGSKTSICIEFLVMTNGESDQSFMVPVLSIVGFILFLMVSSDKPIKARTKTIFFYLVSDPTEIEEDKKVTKNFWYEHRKGEWKETKNFKLKFEE